MANGASLLLPGSNLTNLIVLAHERSSGPAFAGVMVLPWLLVVALTIAFVAVVFRPHPGERVAVSVPPLRFGIGLAATLAAAALMLALRNAALPVLGVGLIAVAVRRIRPRLDASVLAGLFILSVALGTLARRWDWPASLAGRLGGIGSAVLGAGAAVAVNNLPASALLAAHRPPHPLPLLIGLNLGPNLAFTGSLSAYLAVALASLALVDPGAL